MNEQDGHLVGIVRMNHVDACCEPGIIGPKEGSGSASCHTSSVRIEYCQGRRVVGRDGIRAGRRPHDDRVERIIQSEQRHFPSAFFFDGSYSERDAAGRVVLFLRCSFRIFRVDN
jgi:hypothetical protein